MTSRRKPSRKHVATKRRAVKAAIEAKADQEWPLSLPWWIVRGRMAAGLSA